MSFDRAAERYDSTRGGEARGDTFAAEIEPLLVGSAPTLEVGVGTGIVASALRRRGLRLVGVDISLEMLRLGQTRLPGAVAQYDGLRLPFAGNAFDSAYAVWVLHVVQDQLALFRELERVLKPGGRFVVAPTNKYPDDEIGVALQPMFDALFKKQGRRDDPDTLTQVARDAGLIQVARIPGNVHRLETTGLLEAEHIASRDSSALWDVSDADWAAYVVPAVDRLTAMGDSPVTREITHEVLAYEKAKASGQHG